MDTGTLNQWWEIIKRSWTELADIPYPNSRVLVMIPENAGASLRIVSRRLADPGQAKDFEMEVVDVSDASL